MPHSQPTALQQTVCKFHLDPQYHIFYWGSIILEDSTLCIFLNFGQNWDISKIWLQSRFFKYFDQNCYFRKFGPKWRCFKENRGFFENYVNIWNFREFLPNSLFFEKFVQNRDFQTFCLNSRYFEIFLQNRDFQRFWPKALFFANFDQNPDFSKYWHKLRFFWKFDQNRDDSKILI